MKLKKNSVMYYADPSYMENQQPMKVVILSSLDTDLATSRFNAYCKDQDGETRYLQQDLLYYTPEAAIKRMFLDQDIKNLRIKDFLDNLN